MGKRHILNGPHEPLEEGSVVGVLLDHSENIATSSLQDIRQILVVAGHQVAMVIGELPILVGYCSNLHLHNVCVCALFSEKVAHEGGHTPICLCCFLTFHCRHSAKPSNQSVTCPVLLMDGTGHLLVVTVTLETRIDGTEERKNNTERGREKN